MQEQTMEHEDATIGIECKVEKHNNSQNRIRFKNSFANIGDNIVALTLSEHSNYLQQIQHVGECLEKINQLQDEIDNADVKTLQKQLAVYEKQVDNLSKSNNSYKQWNSEFKAKIQNLEQTIADLKEVNDNLAKQLEDSIDASEIEDLQEQVATLSAKLKDAENNATYWQNSYNEMIDSSDALANKNESLIAENEKLRNDNNAINETNQLLNESLLGFKTSFDNILEDKTSDAENKENELKETIKKMQSHIDELTDKYQSLLTKKEYIPPTSHYDEILGLKQEIKDKENEIDKLNGEIETKLATQKSELDIAHADEINNIKLEHANEKAQLFVAYNQEIDNMKLKYNNLANDYNYLLNGVESLTRLNTFVNGKHNEIKKDKEPMELMEITSEQLPPSDENVLEFVPKDETMD